MKTRGVCKVCGVHRVTWRENRSGAGRRWDTMCQTCRRFPHTRNKKDSCEVCGFVATHRCQLDVDHIDGDHGNNELSNLQTLCANCHRLKSYVNADWGQKQEIEDAVEDDQLGFGF